MRAPDIEVLEPSDVFDDLCLMTPCEHVIMADSSLNRWGAWLGPSSRAVITPSCWFGPAYAHHSTQDLYCEGWIRL